MPEFPGGGVGDPENVIESAGGELLIGHGRSAQQALDAAQFHGEDMDDETANVFGTCDVDLDIQRIAVSLKELAPAAGLSVVVGLVALFLMRRVLAAWATEAGKVPEPQELPSPVRKWQLGDTGGWSVSVVFPTGLRSAIVWRPRREPIRVRAPVRLSGTLLSKMGSGNASLGLRCVCLRCGISSTRMSARANSTRNLTGTAYAVSPVVTAAPSRRANLASARSATTEAGTYTFPGATPVQCSATLSKRSRSSTHNPAHWHTASECWAATCTVPTVRIG